VGTATAVEPAAFGAGVPTVDRFTPRRAADGFGADATGATSAAGWGLTTLTAARNGALAVAGAFVGAAVPSGGATRFPRSPADDAAAMREARATGLRRADAPDRGVDPDAGLLMALSEAPAPAPVSANATAVPPTIAAPSPRVTAPAPSHAYGWIRRCFDTERLPRVVIQLP